MDSRPEVLLDELIRAHGGLDRWQSVASLHFSLSSAGLAFSLHQQARALLGLTVTVHPHARRVELLDYTRPGWRGVWTPERIWLEDYVGAKVSEREHPRDAFSQWSRQVSWDALDMLYFAGYALWNYLCFPFLLTQPGVALERVASGRGEGVRRLDVVFAGDFPTHSSRQSFHVDSAGHLLCHDYVADVIGAWAAAANSCQGAEAVEGLRFYTRRRVVPRLGSRLVLPGPTLVWIEIDDLRVVMAG
ncbi:MAG: hypothetical protein AB1899_02220 [Pseudomonadota bacterium]